MPDKVVSKAGQAFSEQMLEYITQALSALDRLEAARGSIAKSRVMSECTDNPVFQLMLKSAYDPFRQFHVKKLPSVTPTGEGQKLTNWHDFVNLLCGLSSRELSGNTALSEVAEVLMACDPAEFKWYSRVLLKDLRCGIAATSINKVFPKLVPVYEVMLADKIPAENLGLEDVRCLPEHAVTQYKIDGYRLNIVRNGDAAAFSRNGKPVYGYDDLLKEAMKLPDGYVYDGEMVSPELMSQIAKNMASGRRVEANRDLFIEAVRGVHSKKSGKKGVFNLFDMVPLSEWKSRQTTEPLSVRMERIYHDILPLRLENILVVPTSRVYDTGKAEDRAEIVKAFHGYLDVGWEGLMLKDWDAPYVFGRSRKLLKMKLMDTLDLPVVSIEEGTGRLTGMMGAAIVEFRGNTVHVGSGWSDAQRKQYWDDQNLLVGKCIEVSYQAVTHDASGKESLSFPVFKSVREDKS